MKILQLNNFEDIRGGSDRVYQLTARMLLDRGHEVATVACGDISFDIRKKSVLLPQNGYVSSNPIVTLRNIRQFIHRPEASQQVKKIVKQFMPDVAHLHIFYGQLSSSVLEALRELKIPCVMTVHEYRMLCPISTMYTQSLGVCERCACGSVVNAITNRCNRGSILASGLSALEVWFRDNNFNYLSNIDHFLMVSEFCRNKHIEYLPDIERKSSVLYNFVPEKDVEKISLPVSDDAPYVYAGRLSHEKGVQLLCEAFTKRPQLQLRIAGAGPSLNELENKYGAAKNIHFLGKLDSATLKIEMKGAKFSIVPSEWYENNPMSILESFGMGTPVLGANIGGIPELVHSGKTGFLFQPSSLESLLATIDIANYVSPTMRQTLSENAITLIRERHSEEIYYEKLMTGYQNSIRWHKAH